MSAVKAEALVWLVPLLLASCAHTGSAVRLGPSVWERELERRGELDESVRHLGIATTLALARLAERRGDPARAERHRARAAELGRREE
jgi:hypothetical protein